MFFFALCNSHFPSDLITKDTFQYCISISVLTRIFPYLYLVLCRLDIMYRWYRLYRTDIMTIMPTVIRTIIGDDVSNHIDGHADSNADDHTVCNYDHLFYHCRDYQQDRPGYRHDRWANDVGCKSIPLLRFGSKRLPEVKFDNYQTYNRHRVSRWEILTIW